MECLNPPIAYTTPNHAQSSDMRSCARPDLLLVVLPYHLNAERILYRLNLLRRSVHQLASAPDAQMMDCMKRSPASSLSLVSDQVRGQ